MFRRLISKNGILLLFIILLLLYIIVFVNRYPNFVVEENTEPTAVYSSVIDVKNTTRNVVYNPNPVKDFVVFQQNCKIPRVDPFFPDVNTFFKPSQFQECAEEPDLFTVRYDQKQKKYIVLLNESLPIILYPNISAYGCVYYEIIRGPNDSLTWINEGPIYFEQDWIVPRHIQAVIVECHELCNKSRIIQRDAFSFVQYPGDRNEKNDQERSRTNPSVVMLGIDSMSQMNFQRTMPLAAEFVRQLGWYEMLGYTNNEESTVSNLISLFTGSTPQKWREKCDINKPGCLESMTFLWDHFHNAGYLTAYAEDTSLFGFIRQPVDYYLRPILGVLETIMDNVRRFGHGSCVGHRQPFRYVFEYCLQLVQRFVKETPKPFFGVFWTKSFSHDDFSGAAKVDVEFVNYLEQYKEAGLFDRAVVILFSDQGQRQGPLMKLKSSFFEERLPMLHIYLPTWYRQQYPEVVQALEVNRRRLSSTIDLHLTIKELMLQVHPCMSFQSHCWQCQSLLKTLPDNRSCIEASIPNHLCPCEPYTQIPISDLMQSLAKLVVYRMNQYLSKNYYDGQCYRLEFAKLLRVETKQYFDDDGNEVAPSDGAQSYLLKFTTRPSGLFRAKALCNKAGNIVKVHEELITRLNPYPTVSSCVNEVIAKKFCLCRSSI